MKKFLDKDFILSNEVAKELYHQFAAPMPVIDYHCHLSPKDIAEDRRFNNLTEAWLEGDHYKWRALRANGVDESFCTGGQPAEEKFMKWAETVPQTLRNPLYHWTHMELKNTFGIETLLSPETAGEIYAEANKQLQEGPFSCRGLLEHYNVEVVCTTDDPIDSLEYHRQIAADGFACKVLPAFRPDKAFAVEDPESYNKYIDKLEEVAGLSINAYSDLLEALQRRVDFFHEHGGRLSDHGFTTLPNLPCMEGEAARIFAEVRSGMLLSDDEIEQFKTSVLLELGRMYHAKGWTQQFHVGATRNNNTKQFKALGPDTGYDSIGNSICAEALSALLDRWDQTDQLPKTIVYNLNPSDNYMLAATIGNFQDGKTAGKVQMGSGWWFLDQKEGIEMQLNALSSQGLLSRFVGMLTDSRSFLSFPRHDYFRRILCDVIGREVEQGLLPYDRELLGQLIKNICYYNAKNYFGFEEAVTAEPVLDEV
ncbi:MAG: glucuronate isomerase [Cytophagales bacterium]|nr:glucuronate isomerase [Cytophagales bacterium]